MYLELNMDLTDEQIALKEAANKFAREVMRPASITLDRMADPESVIAEGSVFWDVMRQSYELGYNSILTRDYSIVQAVTILAVTVYLVVNLGTDLLYGIIDPRIHRG